MALARHLGARPPVRGAAGVPAPAPVTPERWARVLAAALRQGWETLCERIPKAGLGPEGTGPGEAFMLPTWQAEGAQGVGQSGSTSRGFFMPQPRLPTGARGLRAPPSVWAPPVLPALAQKPSQGRGNCGKCKPHALGSFTLNSIQ